MKLKNLTNTDDKLQKFTEYVNNINLDECKYRTKYIQLENSGFKLNNFNPEVEKDIKRTVTELVNRYWKNFESGIDFHRYDGNYFVEIKQESDNKCNFVIEALDDDFYCCFNSDFIGNL